MANITLNGNLSNATVDSRQEGYVRHTSGEIQVNASNNAVIDQDVTTTKFQLNGGTTEGTRCTMTFGNQDGRGVIARSYSSSGWGTDEGSINTSGYSTLNIYNSIIKTVGSSPPIGQYSPTQSQTNVRMNIIDSEIINYTDSTFATLGLGEPMVAPNSLLQNVKFRGNSKVWFNGDLNANSYGIDMISNGDDTQKLGLAVASAGTVTFRKAKTDLFGVQQTPSSIIAYDSKITNGIASNFSTTETRTISLGKTFNTKISGVTSFKLIISDKDNNILSNTNVTVGSETPIDIIWGIWTRSTGGATGILKVPISDLASGTVPTGWTSNVKLPITATFVKYGYKIETTTLNSTNININQDSALEPIVLNILATKLPDITNENEINISGLTTINNAEQLMDYCEYLKKQNIFVPSISERLIYSI